MALIFEHSCLASKAELDLFSELPTQAAIDEGFYTEHLPTGSIDNQNPIKFTVSGDSNFYLDLSNCYLYLETQITNSDDSPLGDDDKVGPINLICQSLFKQCDVYLNDCQISDSSNLYHYRSFLETLLSYSNEAKESQLSLSMYHKDTPGQHDDIADANVGLVKRRAHFAKSKCVPVLGKIHADIFNQQRYLLNGVDLTIKLLRNADKLVLMGEENKNYKLHIKRASFFVRKIKVNAGIQLKHIELLDKSLKPAIYPIRRVTMKTFNVPEGSRSVTEENLFSGILPKRIILGMVPSDAFEGSYTRNPYQFVHENLSYCALNVNGNLLPRHGLNSNFEQNDILQNYFTLFQSTGRAFTDRGLDITREDYPKGYTLLCFDLTPDLEENSCYHLIKKGGIRLEMKFARGLSTHLNIIVYAEYDSNIKIDKNRMVMTNFYA
jgi:hypothetical protein